MNKLEIKQQIFNKLYELYVPEEQFTEESALKLITEYSALKGVNICSKSLNGHRHSLMGSLKTFNMLNDLNIWGPIYKNFVKSLAKYIGDRKVLEVCCGNGWLSTGLMFYGVDIMPTDNFSWILSNRYKVNAYIKNMEAEEAILKYSDRDMILCSWAPYGDPVLERIYDLSKQYKKTFIFIGEINGGCSGQEEFWEREDLKIKELPIEVNSFYGINDVAVILE